MYDRGRRKLIREIISATTSKPGATTDARPTTEDTPILITVVDQNGITDLIKSENIDINDIQNEPNVRKLTRLRSTNPITNPNMPIPLGEKKLSEVV